MPDVNLLRDTTNPAVPPPKKRPGADVPVTDPTPEPKGLGAVFSKLFAKKVKLGKGPIATPALARHDGSTDRILSDKTGSSPAIVPLPDEDTDFSVNLLTEDMTAGATPRKRLIQLGLVALGSIVLLVVVYTGLTFYQRSIKTDVQATQQDVANLDQTVAALEKQTAATKLVKARVDAVKTLIDGHVRWTRFFALLERNTLRQVTYGSGFSGSLTNEITFTAQTDSFEDMARQYLVYKQASAKKDFITAFSITGVSKSVNNKQTVVTFSVSLTLAPTVYLNLPDATATTTQSSN